MPEQTNTEQPKTPATKRVEGLVSWVRLLLPVAIAAIGWYVGNTVGTINDRISAVETGLQEQIVRCAAGGASDAVKFENIKQRLNQLDASSIRDHSNLIKKDDYLRDKAKIEADIEKLENRHTN
jgi:hypothetical protein